VFAHVILHGHIIPSSTADESEGVGLRECFRNGWLHAIATDDGQSKYIFASPLHERYLAWKMFGAWDGSTPDNFPFSDIFDFSCSVISNFSPVSLGATRIIGPGLIQRSPEAHFQHEFYRSSIELTNGRVVTFPEFGTAKGRADFYIPARKWGIELLRDGKNLNEHIGRFGKSGKYTRTLTLDHHILLDFRSKRPVKSHSECIILTRYLAFSFKRQC
jgi:hypothetical protein